MLKPAQIKLLATWGITVEGDAIKFDISKIGINQAALLAAVKDPNEVDFEIKVKPEGFNILDETELTELKARVELDAKTNAERSVPEMLAQTYKEKFGVKLDSNDMEQVIEAVALLRSTEAVSKLNLTVDEQIKLKDADLETVRKSLADVEKEIGTHKSEAERWKGSFESLKDTNDFAQFLGDRVNPLLRPDEYRKRLREEENIDFKKVDGVWKPFDLKGVEIKDKYAKPVPAVDKLTEVLGKRKEWAKPVAAASAEEVGGHGAGGAGGGSGGGGEKKYSNMSSLKEAAASNRWSSKQLKQEYDKAAIEKDFDPNS